MPTPYTTRTGLQIGSLYTSAARPHHDADALRLQSALLGHKPQTDWDGIGIVAVCLAALVTVLVLA